jgi:hypothetical protein
MIARHVWGHHSAVEAQRSMDGRTGAQTPNKCLCEFLALKGLTNTGFLPKDAALGNPKSDRHF